MWNLSGDINSGQQIIQFLPPIYTSEMKRTLIWFMLSAS